MAKTANKVTARTRPYWHVDAKWIFALLLGVAVIVFLWIDTATQATDREVAVPVTTTLVALQFSPDGLDEDTGMEQIRTQWLASDQEEFRPIEGMPIVLTREQVETLSARELRLAVARQMAEPLYDDGVEGFAASISDDPVEREKFENDAQLLGLVSSESHERLSGIRWLALAALIILVAPAVYFSAGLGRLITPGVVLVLASWLGALAFGLSVVATNSSSPPEPSEQRDTVGLALREVDVYLPTVLSGWAVAFGLGAGLLIVAAVWSLVRRARHRE